MTCYEKDENYASCQETCDSSGKGDDKWSCKKLGNRTRFDPGCSWPGEDCSKTACCNNEGFTCAVQDEHFSGCTQTVVKSTWFSKNVPIPSWWNGKVLGGGRSEFAMQPAGPGQKVAGTKLFCFMAILPNSTEVKLQEVAKKNGASIYACDGHVTFNSW